MRFVLLCLALLFLGIARSVLGGYQFHLVQRFGIRVLRRENERRSVGDGKRGESYRVEAIPT
jgi:hypothetical protein